MPVAASQKKSGRASKPKSVEDDSARERLIRAGRTLFSQRPFKSVTAQEIATEAGLAKGLLFYYFRGKKGLFAEVVRREGELLDRATRPDFSLEPMTRARESTRAWVRFAREHAPLYLSVLRNSVVSDEELTEVLDELRSRGVARVLEGFQIPADQASPLLLLSARAWIAYCETALLRWMDSSDVDEDALIELLVQLLFWNVQAVAGEGFSLPT